jgi:hypothetical protein
LQDSALDLRGKNYRNTETPLCAEEALDLAAAEGLTLTRDQKNKSGFRLVHLVKSKEQRKRPYEAWGMIDGAQIWLANFATAEEAALCVARHAADPEGFKASVAEQVRRFQEARDARVRGAAAAKEAAELRRREADEQRRRECERRQEAALERERKRAGRWHPSAHSPLSPLYKHVVG